METIYIVVRRANKEHAWEAQIAFYSQSQATDWMIGKRHKLKHFEWAIQKCPIMGD